MKARLSVLKCTHEIIHFYSSILSYLNAYQTDNAL